VLIHNAITVMSMML